MVGQSLPVGLEPSRPISGLQARMRRPKLSKFAHATTLVSFLSTRFPHFGEPPPTRGKRAIASRSSRSMLLRIYCFEASRNGWKSQARTCALGRGRGDQPAAALAFAHFRVERGEVPARGDLGAERGDPLGVAGLGAPDCRARPDRARGRRAGRDRPGEWMNLSAPAPDHHQGRNCALGQIFADRLVVAARARRDGARELAPSIDGARARRVAAGEDRRASAGGSTSDTLAPTRTGANRPGLAMTSGHAARALEEAHLVPEAALAEHFAVVADEDDDRVFGEPARAQAPA